MSFNKNDRYKLPMSNSPTKKRIAEIRELPIYGPGVITNRKYLLAVQIK